MFLTNFPLTHSPFLTAPLEDLCIPIPCYFPIFKNLIKNLFNGN